MPKNEIFSNEEALKRGKERAKWKINTTLEYFKNTTYKKDSSIGFDFRDMYSLIPLLIDISEVANSSEDVKKEFFISKLKEMEQAFITPGPINPKMPDPERIKPYIKRMYETIYTNENQIDWDDEASIDHVFCSIITTQAIGTMVEKFPREIIELYPTRKESEKVDVLSARSYFLSDKLRNELAKRDRDMLKELTISPNRTDTYLTQVWTTTQPAFFDSIEKGSSVTVLDPTVTSVSKNHFLGKKFSFDEPLLNPGDDPSTFDSDDAAFRYLEALSDVASKSVIEYITDKGVDKKIPYLDLLYINGKTAEELVNEKMQDEGMRQSVAKREVGKILRDALTDGKSIITLLRPAIEPDGKTTFKHHEIKVDLDKLNKLERKENHNAFRRFLDKINLWKIKPQYASNEERDRVQSETKGTDEYKNMLRAAEDKFINTYNEISQENHSNVLLDKIPVATRKENSNENEISANEIDDVRHQVVISEILAPPAALR